MQDKLKRKATKLEIIGSILIVSLMFGGIIIAQHYSKIAGAIMTLSSIIIPGIAYFIFQLKNHN